MVRAIESRRARRGGSTKFYRPSSARKVPIGDKASRRVRTGGMSKREQDSGEEGGHF